MTESGDYISREAVLRDWPLCDEPGDAYQFIRNFHAADVRPVERGKWLGTHDGFYYTYSCSECGYEALYKENTKDQVCSSFCPSCGARMEES